MARLTVMDQIMSEPVRFPGFPQIIVTRGWAYQYFVNHGWSPAERGFSSMEWMIFGTCRNAVNLPLTDEETRDCCIAQAEEILSR